MKNSNFDKENIDKTYKENIDKTYKENFDKTYKENIDKTFREKIENSVVQIFVEQAIFDEKFPYRAPKIENFSGSGFIILKEKETIYILTNAHVIENSLTIEIRFPFLGKYPIKAKLKSFCFFRDIALVEINKELSSDKWELIQQNAICLEFADSLKMKQQDKIYIAGYPLGEENLQIASGDISGFSVIDNKNISFLPQSYIQVTAPMNPGNSGGPSLNMDGQVIGINSAGVIMANNIAYVIPSRNIFAIYDKLFETKFIYQANFGLKINSYSKGLYISKIYPNSIFYGNENYDDNINYRRLKFLKDIYELDYPNKIVEIYENKIKQGDILKTIQVINKGEIFLFNLDNYGIAKLDKYNWRTFNLYDIEEFTTYNTEVIFTIIRGDKTLQVKEIYLPRQISKYMIRPIYPLFEPERFQYILLGGMILMENQYKIDDTDMNDDEYFCRKIQVITLFKGTEIDSYHTIKEYDVLVKINDMYVFTLFQIQDILNNLKHNLLILDFKNSVHLELEYSNILKEDIILIEKYQLKS